MTLPHQILLRLRGLVDDELVVGRAAGEGAGARHQRPEVRQVSFPAADGRLVELGGGQAPMNLVEVAQAKVREGLSRELRYS